MQIVYAGGRRIVIWFRKPAKNALSSTGSTLFDADIPKSLWAPFIAL